MPYQKQMREEEQWSGMAVEGRPLVMEDILKYEIPQFRRLTKNPLVVVKDASEDKRGRGRVCT
jgi:hypothetical protein